MVLVLKEQAANGVEVVLFSRQQNEQTDYLVSVGLTVRVIPNLSLCAAIIDKSTIWYGSINPLGYVSEDDNTIRLKDINLANEMLNIAKFLRR